MSINIESHPLILLAKKKSRDFPTLKIDGFFICGFKCFLKVQLAFSSATTERVTFKEIPFFLIDDGIYIR